MDQLDRRNRQVHPRKSSRHILVAAATVFAAFLFILGALFITMGCGDGSATDGPESVVQDFLSASENKDVDAVLALMDPQVVASMEDELTGTGMTMDDVKSMLADEFFPYDSVTFSNIKLETTELGDNSATVEIVGGSLTQTVDGQTETVDANDSDEPLEFYLVQIDGKWYIDFESM